MPYLRDEMQRYLHQWQDNLPTTWREKLCDVEPDFGAVPQCAPLDEAAQIVPVLCNGGGVFYALEGIDPSDVRVVLIGNDPYPDPDRATGRSFEQGDLTSWIDDLAVPGRVTPSLLSLVCAAVALLPGAEGLKLDHGSLHDRREKLRQGLQSGAVVLLRPRPVFENLTGRGVLWINRTPTISVFHSGRCCRGGAWQAIKEQRKWHRALWRPVTHTIISALVEEASQSPIVFALFGSKAKSLRRWIETQGTGLGVPRDNLCFVESGHPSVPRYFFRSRNPLRRINHELTVRGCDPIDWCGIPPRGKRQHTT